MNQRCSTQGIMKNVYDFVKILETAHGEAVQGWKEVDLQNAYKWADFCVQLFDRAEGKPFRTDLERHMRSFNELSWSLGDLVIDIYLLQSGKHRLTKALLQNPHLTTPVFDELVRLSVEEGTTQFTQTITELATRQSALEMGTQVLSELRLSTQLSTGNHSLLAQGSLLIRHVRSILETASDRRTKAVEGLKEKLTNICQDDAGVKSLLLALRVRPVDEGDFGRAKDFIASLLMSISKEDTVVKRRIFQTDRNILRALAKDDPRFNELFLQYLFDRSSQLQPDYSNFPVKWRCRTNKNVLDPQFTYHELCCEIKHLLECSTLGLKSSLVEELLAKAKESDFNVWKCVLKDMGVNVSS